MLRRRGDSAHSLFLKLDGLSFIFGGVKFLSKLEKKPPNKQRKKTPNKPWRPQRAHGSAASKRSGVFAVRFSAQTAAAAAVVVSACLSLSLLPLNTTDRDLEDTGRGIKLPIIVDFLSCLPHMGETGNVKFRPKSVVS